MAEQLTQYLMQLKQLQAEAAAEVAVQAEVAQRMEIKTEQELEP